MNWSSRSVFIFYGGLFLSGVLFFLLYNEFLIVKFSLTPHALETHQELITKKIITFSVYKEQHCQTEEIEILWHTQKDSTVMHITNRWLELLEETQEKSQKIKVQNVSLSDNQKEIYISFNRPPFAQTSSTYQKLLCIESLLKTLKDAQISWEKIFFLVDHEPINDPHLDFSHGWPFESFIIS